MSGQHSRSRNLRVSIPLFSTSDLGFSEFKPLLPSLALHRQDQECLASFQSIRATNDDSTQRREQSKLLGYGFGIDTRGQNRLCCEHQIHLSPPRELIQITVGGRGICSQLHFCHRHIYLDLRKSGFYLRVLSCLTTCCTAQRTLVQGEVPNG